VIRAAALVAALLLALPAAAQRDEDIRRMIVEDSIARFSGFCPCPYSYDRGQQCADKSAYSRRIDPWLKCYTRDVHWRDIEAYRDRMGYPTPFRRYYR
jgi:hypothetical protein